MNRTTIITKLAPIFRRTTITTKTINSLSIMSTDNSSVSIVDEKNEKGGSSSKISSKGTNNNGAGAGTVISKQRYINVETANVVSFMNSCKPTKKFKVHKPNCNCQKMNVVVQKIHANALQKDTGNVGNQKQQEIEDVDHSKRALDGLVLTPDVNSIKSVFLCLESSPSSKFHSDPLHYEIQLGHRIYATSQTSNTDPVTSVHLHATMNDNDGDYGDYGDIDVDTKKIIVRCANCLLKMEPNGFVCIVSQSKAALDAAIKQAHQHKLEKLSKRHNLHADHAEYLCVVPLKLLVQISLQNMNRKNKRKNVTEKKGGEKGNLIEKFFHLIREQQDIDTCDNDGQVLLSDLRLGHHLASVLIVLNNKKERKLTDRKDLFIIVTLIKKDQKESCVTWDVNIPGGKRHLGETSWDCAVRETEEETSLVIDESWLRCGDGDLLPTSVLSAQKENRYYILQPPTDVSLDSIIDDEFWKTEAL